jgi:dipeptidyl-peptidase-4
VLFASVLAACLVGPLAARAQDPSILTLERIYASGDFRGEFFAAGSWLSDGSGYLTFERSEEVEGGRDIVRHDPETGATDVLVPAARLIPEGESQPLRASGYQWSEDGKQLLIFANSRRVWRRATRGDYWVLDLETWELQKLGGDFDESRLMFAKFSPSADRVAYVYYNNVYVEDLASGVITQLTHDGDEKLINGTSDWVNEEEFDLRDGFRWSPDGEYIAYWQFDSEGVHEFYLVNNTDSIYPRITTIPFPKAGTTNSAVRVGVVSAAGGETRWFELEGDPRNNYVPRMEWVADPSEVVIQYMNRLQNTNHVMLGDPVTGELRTILTESDEAWVDPVDDLEWLEGDEYFTWVSDRDGWNHVYVVSRDGEEVRSVTPGEYDAIGIQRIDVEGGWVYFSASPENATQRYLYRAPLEGRGRAERLTPADQPGTHNYRISLDARWAFHTYSSFGVPSTIELVRLPGHEVQQTFVENTELRGKIDALKKGPAEFFKVDIGDGVVLDGWQMLPPDFDPSKKYPVLFYTYGGPWGSTVRDAWGGGTYLWHMMLTQKGYIVMSVDNRGTPVPKGREFRKIIYGTGSGVAAEDQAAAVRVIDTWPYVDPSRIAMWGWSNGGSMSLHAILRFPELYNTALAVAPVPDERLYDTIYQERYLGLPDDNAEGYAVASAVTYASQLEGNLLIVHGTGDDNVHYQGTEVLINALVAANKQFTIMPYPNRSHGIFEGRGTTLHLRYLLTNYLMENMPPGPAPEATE